MLHSYVCVPHPSPSTLGGHQRLRGVQSQGQAGSDLRATPKTLLLTTRPHRLLRSRDGGNVSVSSHPRESRLMAGLMSCFSQGIEFIFLNIQFTSNSKDRSLLRGQNKGRVVLCF